MSQDRANDAREDREDGRAEDSVVERYRAVLRAAEHAPREAGLLLHDLFAEDVNRMVWRLVGKDQEHDDLVNEVFVRLLRDIGQVREPAGLRSWVFRVTINLVRSELRKRTVFRRYFVKTERSADDFVGTSPDHEKRELLARTFSLLDRIRADERIVLVLHCLEERPLKEVCALCDCSMATAKRRLSRARKRFALLAERDSALRHLLDKGQLSGGKA